MSEASPDIKLQAPPVELERDPFVANEIGLGEISDQICDVIERPTPLWWKICMAPALLLLSMLGCMIFYLMSVGVGVWGNQHPVMWGWAIINFVW